jgi:alpha-tubulin suppressor-like RCC1 family protein
LRHAAETCILFLMHRVLAAALALTACSAQQPGSEPAHAPVSVSPPPAMKVLRVSAGRAHACALMADRTVQCWGHGAHGQLGIGALPVTFGVPKPLRIGSVPVPSKVVGLSDVTQIACGGHHSCALRSNGTIACWGSNVHGELGDGSTMTRMAPINVEGITSATQIALGDGRSCARVGDGTVRCWGSGDTTPKEVPSVVAATSVAVGSAHACVVEAGFARCWGANDDGQLGDGTKKAHALPERVVDLRDVVQLALGDHHSCARLEDGSARCWGCGEWGQLGNGGNDSHLTPQPVSGLLAAIDLSARSELTAATRHDGVLVLWGRVPSSGVLRDELGRSIGREYVTIPSVLGDYPDVVEVTLGAAFGCARNIRNELRCFGDNDFGQHGNGTFVTPAW